MKPMLRSRRHCALAWLFIMGCEVSGSGSGADDGASGSDDSGVCDPWKVGAEAGRNKLLFFGVYDDDKEIAIFSPNPFRADYTDGLNVGQSGKLKGYEGFSYTKFKRGMIDFAFEHLGRQVRVELRPSEGRGYNARLFLDSKALAVPFDNRTREIWEHGLPVGYEFRDCETAHTGSLK